MKKKGGIFCQHCKAQVQTFKKGKHKLYVCPNCGILAFNPTLAGSILRAGVGFIPGVGGIASTIVGGIQEAKDRKREITQESLAQESLSPQREVGRQGFMPRRQGSADQLIRLIQAEKMLGR
ncbi:MAG: hypothetical protein NTU93_00025 [Arthrobacter sp.]|nr:hypothetical protein [Arthrobacter sp.]